MATIHDLIAETLPGQRFGIFYSTGEGRFYPNGEEESSGFVVAEDGSHWFYWTTWQDGRVGFKIWESELYQEEWSDCPEYQSAAQAATTEAS